MTRFIILEGMLPEPPGDGTLGGGGEAGSGGAGPVGGGGLANDWYELGVLAELYAGGLGWVLSFIPSAGRTTSAM